MPERKQVLMLSSSYPASMSDGRAASGFFVRDFAEKLADLTRLRVLTQHTGEGPHEIMDERYSVIRFPWFGNSRPLSTLRLPRDLFAVSSVLIAGITAGIRQARLQKVDYVIAMWAIPCGVWALLLNKIYKIPYTVWCLGADVWNYQKSPLARIILKLVLTNAKSVYADGFELSDAVNDIAQVKCTYLPTSRNLAIPEKKFILKPEGVRHYLFVGRYHLNKGPDILIQAIHLLPRAARSKIHCHFFGGGPLAAELEQLVGRLGLEDIITLGGFIGEKELAGVLYATDVVVIPSRKDTISLMISAALQMNKRIIATDVGDMGYVLKKYRVGYIVSANSPESFAQAMQEDLSTPHKQDTGHASLLELLDISNAVSSIMDDITLVRSN